MDQPLLSLTAADLMTQNLVLVPLEMSLQGAARLLSRAQVSGAPVVDSNGRCIGVLSTTDFLRCVENGTSTDKPQEAGEAVCRSWQILNSEASPSESVSQYMTGDPVTVFPGAPIGELAQMMMDARIHRVIVVDHRGCPIGLVSSMDILAAIAREAQSHGLSAGSPAEFEASGIG